MSLRKASFDAPPGRPVAAPAIGVGDAQRLRAARWWASAFASRFTALTAAGYELAGRGGLAGSGWLFVAGWLVVVVVLVPAQRTRS